MNCKPGPVHAGLRRRVRAADVAESQACSGRSTRRAFLLAAGAWLALSKAGAVLAQQAPIVIGWLSVGSRESGGHFLAAFKEGLAALGWKDGSQFVIEAAISRLAKEGAQALVVMTSPFLSTERRRIVKLALARRWAVIGSNSDYAEAGALLSYGADGSANFRRAAWYVDRILKGAKPGDLPMEQPTRLELVVNAKTAKALGLRLSSEILLRADRVIE